MPTASLWRERYAPATRSAACREQMVEAGAGVPPRGLYYQLAEQGLTGPAAVRRVLDDAAASGLNLLRMNAFAVDPR